MLHVVPAKAGTHTPCLLARARKQMAFQNNKQLWL